MRWSVGGRVGGFIVIASIVAACSGSDGATIAPATTAPTIVAATDPSAATNDPVNTPPPDRRVCAPSPGAACSLAESFDPPLGPAADLTGIDLRGATLGEEIDLSDAVLVGARLDDATVLGKLTGADLTSASLAGADLSGTDLTNATVTGATLTGAQVNATLFDTTDLSTATMTQVTVGVRSGETLAGVDLSGFDLTGVSFSSRASGPISMSAARFTGATLTGASFSRVDLTAANFTDAVFAVEGGAEPSFTETRCPDFLPSDDTLTGRAGCRL